MTRNVRLFINTFEQWRQYLVMAPVKYEETDLQGDAAGIKDNAEMLTDKNVSVVQYNAKAMKKRIKAQIVGDALHELGHYIQRLPYKTNSEKVLSEYSAERFALSMLKTFYPELYLEKIKQMQAQMKDTKIWETDSIYKAAYEKIEEYSERAAD